MSSSYFKRLCVLTLSVWVLTPVLLWASDPLPPNESRLSLNHPAIIIDPAQPSYVQYAAHDLADYLGEITGAEPPIVAKSDEHAPVEILIGKQASQSLPGLIAEKELGDEGYLLRSFQHQGRLRIAVTGFADEGTNFGIAALMRMVRADGKSAYLRGPVDVRSKPSFAIRGIHLNGWSFNYPYAYRPWKEADWERFIDLLWCQGANLLYMLPMMEIMPVPLSSRDEAYLQEVRRVIDYAHEKRGIKVWLMTSANRVAVSDCGEPDPKLRQFWVNKCQVDMNPADPQQFERIMKAFGVLYRSVSNADGFGMIDSDPGGWPQSPISDQVKIFKGARALLDQNNLRSTPLIDWMWVGWGRHKFPASADTVVGEYDWTEKNPDTSDIAFMQQTIRSFQKGLPEPWSLIAGFSPYLGAAKSENVLGNTTFLPYGAIEFEPSFPMTNLGLRSVGESLEVLSHYPATHGLMGNNMTPLLQLPRTYFFLASAWDYNYRHTSEDSALRELSRELYPDHEELIAQSFASLGGTEPEKIDAVLGPLEKLIAEKQLGRAGALGRKIFPNDSEVARDLVYQLKIRVARERLTQRLSARPDRAECERLVEAYLESLLAWDQQTGWDRLLRLGLWRAPIYSADKAFNQSLSILKRSIGNGSAVTDYAAVSSFFDPMTKRLIARYGEDAVMIGCIEPLKLAVIQAP